MTKSSLPVGGCSVNPYVGCTHACKLKICFNFLDEVEILAPRQSVTLEQTYGRRKTA